MTSHAVNLSSTESRRLGELEQPLFHRSLVVAGVALGISLLLGLFKGDSGKHLLHSYLVSYAWLLTISACAIFFVALQHLVGAAWSVTSRRLAEVIAANIIPMAILALPIFATLLVGSDSLYSWNNAATVQATPLLAKKVAYLNAPFFCIRLAFYLTLWCAMGWYFHSKSVKQDQTGDPELTEQMRGVSAPMIVAFSLSLTFAAFDLLMSLSPLWYSTIFGVYIFAGGLVGFFALWILVALYMQSTGRLTESITVEHYHDLGKFLFGFVFFWGYIAFSQYLLIWYANLPEETIWYVERQNGSWVYVSIVLLFGHFVIPFLGLLSRHAKRNLKVLGGWAVFLLVMHWIDLYYIVMPSFAKENAPFHLMDLTLMIGLGALYVAGLVRTASRASLLPERDPRLARSLTFQNV